MSLNTFSNSATRNIFFHNLFYLFFSPFLLFRTLFSCTFPWNRSPISSLCDCKQLTQAGRVVWAQKSACWCDFFDIECFGLFDALLSADEKLLHCCAEISCTSPKLTQSSLRTRRNKKKDCQKCQSAVLFPLWLVRLNIIIIITYRKLTCRRHDNIHIKALCCSSSHLKKLWMKNSLDTLCHVTSMN